MDCFPRGAEGRKSVTTGAGAGRAATMAGRRTVVRPPGAVAALTGLLFAASGCGPDSTAPPPVSPAPGADPVSAWLDAKAHPFAGAHLSLPHDDLEFLRDLVGDARIVALGENTHGTRDFFEMKARILRFLVEEMGFDTFAIEATWPEARRLDHYVRTGEGDPEVLLSGLYFWTWNTESVLEMIEWMRAHNEAGGDLGFHGVDMQFPGMALHLVREYIRTVDPGIEALMTEKLDCLARVANDHRRRWPSLRYGDRTDAYRRECAASLWEARDFLVAKREEYELASGEDAFEIAQRALRVAFQYHLHITGVQSRDESMAENTAWLSRRLGPGGRMVLWAHNTHVGVWYGSQGWYLRQTFGDDMVVFGFTHERGRLTAKLWETDRERCGAYAEFDLDPPVAGSYEAHLARASAPRFVLDLRALESEPGNEWLSISCPFRHSGACYSEEVADLYWREVELARRFDAIIHFETTRPTTLLPFRFPSSF